MEEGLVDKSDSELEKIWRNKTNSQYSKTLIESVRQEMLNRKLSLTLSETTASEKMNKVNESPVRKAEFPFVMKAKLQNKVLAALVLPVGLIVLCFVLRLLVEGISSRDILPLLLVLIVGLPFGMFLCIWPILAVTKIVCTTEGIEFSAFSAIYSRILWKDITKVDTQNLNFSGAFGTVRVPGHGDIKVIEIFHKGAFLGMASAIGTENYRQEDLATLRTLIYQNVSIRITTF